MRAPGRAIGDEGDRVHNLGAALWLLANADMTPMEWIGAAESRGWTLPRNSRSLVEQAGDWVSSLQSILDRAHDRARRRSHSRD